MTVRSVFSNSSGRSVEPDRAGPVAGAVMAAIMTATSLGSVLLPEDADAAPAGATIIFDALANHTVAAPQVAIYHLTLSFPGSEEGGPYDVNGPWNELTAKASALRLELLLGPNNPYNQQTGIWPDSSPKGWDAYTLYPESAYAPLAATADGIPVVRFSGDQGLRVDQIGVVKTGSVVRALSPTAGGAIIAQTRLDTFPGTNGIPPDNGYGGGLNAVITLGDYNGTYSQRPKLFLTTGGTDNTTIKDLSHGAPAIALSVPSGPDPDYTNPFVLTDVAFSGPNRPQLFLDGVLRQEYSTGTPSNIVPDPLCNYLQLGISDCNPGSGMYGDVYGVAFSPYALTTDERFYIETAMAQSAETGHRATNGSYAGAVHPESLMTVIHPDSLAELTPEELQDCTNSPTCYAKSWTDMATDCETAFNADIQADINAGGDGTLHDSEGNVIDPYAVVSNVLAGTQICIAKHSFVQTETTQYGYTRTVSAIDTDRVPTLGPKLHVRVGVYEPDPNNGNKHTEEVAVSEYSNSAPIADPAP